MFVSPAGQGVLVLYSLVCGVIIGIIYDVFRLTDAVILAFFGIKTHKFANCERCRTYKSYYRIFTKAFLDIFFSAIYTVLIVILVFGAGGGVFRYFLILFAAVGFLMYYLTIGKLTGKLFGAVSKLICRCFISFIKLIYSLTEPLTTAYREVKLRKYIIKSMGKRRNGDEI